MKVYSYDKTKFLKVCRIKSIKKFFFFFILDIFFKKIIIHDTTYITTVKNEKTRKT